MPTPAVSVNMCVWRPHERYFREAVQSILDQTFPDFELIIVEDPSEHDGRAMIPDLLKDPRIRYVHNTERTGFEAQKNLGLRLSNATYVAMMDADDIAEPERLERQLQFLRANPNIQVVGSWIRIINANGEPIGIRHYPTSPQAVKRAMRRYNALAHPSVVVSREIALAVGAYDPQMHLAEDYDLWARVLSHGYNLANVPEPLLRYRLHPAAAKAERTTVSLRKTIEVKKRYFARNFTLADRMRYTAEHCLLMLPPRLVYWLFCILTFRSEK
ncbi:MAG: glycosyltransferase [Thermogutta sp.]